MSRKYGSPYNRVSATKVSGKIKCKRLDVLIGQDWEATHILIDGKEMKGVQGIWIKCLKGQKTKITLELIR